ncbi:hypothetical protein Patl1_09659 [Pistacia atlantica]|uniref:Uncharacterized protein n=1 Tax=Pistacia atlantica TaxID=434234 RepID=A0ACC1A326_9ROSI|nr:hypothetical protein Patl1_09659 [Pistacia atlantica]
MFSTLIGCARVCPGKAVELFEKMPSHGCESDDVTFSAMIDAYGRAGNVDMALSLYDRARNEKCRIDRMTFSTLIKTYGTTGNFDSKVDCIQTRSSLGKVLAPVMVMSLFPFPRPR